MKYIIVLLFPIFCFSQTFESGVSSYAGLNLKAKSKIEIKDSILTVVTQNKSQIDSLSFKVLRKAHGGKQIYFTDGIKTHSFSYGEMKGKIKGYKYTHVVNLSYDNIQGPITVLYYSILK